jgi:hypothetical protein
MTDHEARSLALDDASRTVAVTGTPPQWDASGTAGDVARWLGNATEHDCEAIRELARRIRREGKALLVVFPSVLPFILGYAGNGRYVIRVTEPADPEQRKVWDEYQPRDKR